MKSVLKYAANENKHKNKENKNEESVSKGNSHHETNAYLQPTAYEMSAESYPIISINNSHVNVVEPVEKNKKQSKQDLETSKQQTFRLALSTPNLLTVVFFNTL